MKQAVIFYLEHSDKRRVGRYGIFEDRWLPWPKSTPEQWKTPLNLNSVAPLNMTWEVPYLVGHIPSTQEGY